MNNITLCVIGTILLFGILQINSFQQLYTFIPERCEYKNINASLIKVYNAKCFKKSRLELYLNYSMAMKVDILSDDDEQIKITGYQFRSNEYRKGPIEFTLGMCSAFHLQLYDLPNILSTSNMRSCPKLKDKVYYGYNIAPNASNMPPLLPDGRWMFEIKHTYQYKYEIMRFEFYVTIEYPIRIFEKRA